VDSAQTARWFDTGVDYWIAVQARQAGKRIIALESVEDRLHAMHRAFEGKPCGSQARLLEDYLAARTAGDAFGKDDFIRLVNHWRNGDMEALEGRFERFRADSDILFESLVGGRNRIWLPRIVDQRERSHSTFVVVGSGHLAGPENLLHLLEKKGLNVERVQ